MLNVQLKLTGDIEKAMDKLGAALGEKALRSAGFAGAQVIQEEVKVRAMSEDGKARPYATGLLRDNIIIKRAEEKSEGANRQTYLILVGKITRSYANTKHNVRKSRVGKDYELEGTAFYWRFLEFGTSNMSAHPFIRPAFDAKIDDALEVIRVRLGENLKGVA